MHLSTACPVASLPPCALRSLTAIPPHSRPLLRAGFHPCSRRSARRHPCCPPSFPQQCPQLLYTNSVVSCQARVMEPPPAFAPGCRPALSLTSAVTAEHKRRTGRQCLRTPTKSASMRDDAGEWLVEQPVRRPRHLRRSMRPPCSADSALSRASGNYRNYTRSWHALLAAPKPARRTPKLRVHHTTG